MIDAKLATHQPQNSRDCRHRRHTARVLGNGLPATTTLRTHVRPPLRFDWCRRRPRPPHRQTPPPHVRAQVSIRTVRRWMMDHRNGNITTTTTTINHTNTIIVIERRRSSWSANLTSSQFIPRIKCHSEEFIIEAVMAVHVFISFAINY